MPFDPDSYLSSASPAASAASIELPEIKVTPNEAGGFDPDEYLKPAAAQQSLLESAATPITSIPSTFKKIGEESRAQMSRGLQQIEGPTLGGEVTGENKDLYSGNRLWDIARGVGNLAGGALDYTFSPINAPFQTIVGDPVTRSTGSPFLGSMAQLGAGFLLPIPTRLPRFSRAAVEAPAEEAPFGVTLTQGEAEQNLRMQQREQQARRLQSGTAPNKVATDFDTQRAEQIPVGKDIATAQLHPTGEILARTPQDAGEAISQAVQEWEANRAATVADEGEQLRNEANFPGFVPARQAANSVADALRTSSEAVSDQGAARNAQLLRDRESLRGSLNNDGTVIASNPQEASDIISAGVTRAEEQATAVRDAAYEKFENIPGSFRPKAFVNVANDVRRTLNDPKDPFILNNQTPNTAAAIDHLDTDLGAPARIADDPATQSFAPFTPARINNIRKNLNARWRAAKNTANATNDYSDLEGMNRVIGSFDDIVDNALKKKRLFDGDGKAISQAWDDANAAHADLRKTFSRQGSGDTVGPVMSKIVGQREGQAMPANAIEQATMTTKGGQPVLMGRRLQSVFGPTSPEIGALKQGAYSKAIEPPEGVAPFAPEKIANNLHELASSELGRTHFTPDELRRIRQHAEDTRASVPVPRPKTDVVGKTIDDMNGVGGQPWTADQVSNLFFGKDGTGPDALGQKMVQHVKDTYGIDSPEFRALQSGQISKLSRLEEGRAGFDPQGIADDYHEFLNSPHADTLYTPEQKAMLSDFADRLDAHAKTTVMPGANDPVEKALARISGRDGKPPASSSEVAAMLLNRANSSDKMLSIELAKRLKTMMPPEKFAAVKQGLFRQVIEPGPGTNLKDWTPLHVRNNIADLLNKSPDLVKAIYDPEDIDMIRAYQQMNQKMIPMAGSIQTSGNAGFIRGVAQAIGQLIAVKLAEAAGLGFMGQAASLGVASTLGKVGEARQAAKLRMQMPIVGQQVKQYQQALSVAQKNPQIPSYKARAALLGGQLSNTLGSMGIDMRALQAPATVGAQDQNKNDVPRPVQHKNGGGVYPQIRAHGGTVGDSASPLPRDHPVIHGAKLAGDGHYYMPDSSRPGKYLRVVERAAGGKVEKTLPNGMSYLPDPNNNQVIGPTKDGNYPPILRELVKRKDGGRVTVEPTYDKRGRVSSIEKRNERTRKRTITTVTKHDKKGRIVEFETREEPWQ